MAGFLCVAESAGGRIIRTGVGFTQVGDPYQFDVYTQDDRPLGDDGEAEFRWVTVLLKHSNGYNVIVQPIVDGIPQLVGSFSGGPPPAGTLEEVVRLRVWLMARGNRIAAKVTSVSLLGPLELVDIPYGYVAIRSGL